MADAESKPSCFFFSCRSPVNLGKKKKKRSSKNARTLSSFSQVCSSYHIWDQKGEKKKLKSVTRKTSASLHAVDSKVAYGAQHHWWVSHSTAFFFFFFKRPFHFLLGNSKTKLSTRGKKTTVFNPALLFLRRLCVFQQPLSFFSRTPHALPFFFFRVRAKAAFSVFFFFSSFLFFFLIVYIWMITMSEKKKK